MTKRKTTVLFIALLTLSSVLLWTQTVWGIGQMTKPIVVENALRGEEFSAVLTLINSENKEVPYGLEATGKIKDWASFYAIEDKSFENPITRVQILPESKIKAIVKFAIPIDVSNGTYSGEVVVVSVSDDDSEIGKVSTTVLQRVGRKVSITVTDEEVVELDTTIIPLNYRVGKNEPLKIKIIHHNQGNVSIEPDIQLKITKRGETVFNAIFPYPEDENPVRPLERKVMSSLIEWPTAGQSSGQYKAEMTVLLDGEVIKKSDFRFNVGFTVNRFLDYISRLGGGNLVLGWFIIGGFFIMLSMMLTFAGRKRGIWEKLRRR